MSEEVQHIQLEGETRVSINITGAPVTVNWREDIAEILATGPELEVHRVAGEIFLNGRTKGGGGQGILGMLPNISVPGVTIDWGDGSSSIEVDDRGVVVRRGRSDQSGGTVFQIDLPLSITTTTIDVARHDLLLMNPTGSVESRIKSGKFRSLGGNAEMTVGTGSGDSQVAKLSGALNLMGGSGDISVQDCQTITNIKAGSGEVSLAGIRGDALKVTAGSGDVEIQNCVTQAFSCQTGSGDIRIAEGQHDRISIRTGSGDVDCTAVFGPYNQSFQTGSGSVSLGVPRGLPARFEVATHGGDIDSDIQMVSVGQRGPRSRRTRRQVGSVGTGEPRADVTIRTASGDIRLHWLSVAATAIPAPPPAPSVPLVATMHQSGGRDQSADRDEGEGPERGIEEDAEPGLSEPEKEILDALARGEITIEEAEILLSQLETGGQSIH